MIALLLLCLGVSSITSHPVSGGKACSTLTSFQKSLDNAVMCKDFQPKTECTTASLEIVKKCLDGIKVDAKCLREVYEKLSGDQDCFCGGLVKFSQMLTSVEALLCAEDQGRVSKLFFANMFPFNQETTTATTSATSTATTTGTGTTAATTTRASRLFFPSGESTTTASTASTQSTTRAPRLIFPNAGASTTATTASTQTTTRAPRLIFPNQGVTTTATTASTQSTTTRAPRLFFPNALNLPNIFGDNGGDAAKPEPDTTTTAASTTASTTGSSVSTATSAASTTTTASQTTTTAASTTTTTAATTTTTAATTTTTAP